VTSFGLAWNQRSSQGGEEKAHYFDVTCWRELAENVAESISRGSRVVVYGRLDYRSWENENGEKRSAVQIVADEVAPSIRWATAEVTKIDRRSDNESGAGGYSGQGGQPTAGAGESFPDEEPF
jgi:single-strand DNA-binding protein